jgi:hypothetical protein
MFIEHQRMSEVCDHKRELATKADILEVKGDIREAELRLTKEIEQVKSSTIKWVVGWVAGLLIAYTGVIITILTLLK